MELLCEVTGREEIKTLVSKFSVETGALEDAYITSRHIARTYTPEEIMRLNKVVEELTRAVGKIVS